MKESKGNFPRVLALVAGAMIMHTASAEVWVAAPDRDTSIYSNNIDASNGGNPSLFVGRISDVFGDPPGFTSRRALMGFDLQGIPAGSTINSVTLRLTITRNSVRDARTTDTFHIHRLVTDWGEGTVNGGALDGVGQPAEPGDATWRSSAHTSTPWATPGGDFVASPSASLTNIPVINPGLGETADVTWSGPGMVSDVQAWVDNPAGNFGWILLPDVTNGEKSARIFASRESLGGIAPALTIDYTPVPEPASLAILALGVIGLARRTTRRP